MRNIIGVASLLLLIVGMPVAQPLVPADTAFGAGGARYFDTPVNPDIYLMRPGDVLQVTFIDAQVGALTLTLDPEVRVVDRTLGVFDLAGKTLTQAREELREVLSKLYHADQIAISVTAPRRVAVQVSGAVNKPGLYVLYTSQRVSEAVDSADGIRRGGSRRFITLRGGPKDLPVDLDRASYLGEQAYDPPLYAGQLIYVPSRREATVSVVGEVNNPREVELVAGDSLATLISLAGGLRSAADRNTIKIIRGSDEIAAAGATLQPRDIIVVPSRPEAPAAEGLIVYGAVTKPGRYEFVDGETLRSLLSRAGGFAPTAAPDGTTIFRRPPQTDGSPLVGERFPMGNLIDRDGQVSEISLRPQDSVFVPAAIGLVWVSGEVRNPGTYPFAAGKTASYYINLAGGMLPTAEKARVNAYKRISGITSTMSPESIVHDGDEVIVLRREELQ